MEKREKLVRHQIMLQSKSKLNNVLNFKMANLRQNTFEKKKLGSNQQLLQMPQLDNSPVPNMLDSKINLSKISDSFYRDLPKCCHQLTYQQVECQIES